MGSKCWRLFIFGFFQKRVRGLYKKFESGLWFFVFFSEAV